jgi:hypothetical protein
MAENMRFRYAGKAKDLTKRNLMLAFWQSLMAYTTTYKPEIPKNSQN